jgi:hypothetical protein
MQITKSKLKKIMQEELQKIIKEEYTSVLDYPELAALESRDAGTRTLDDYLERMMFPQAGERMASITGGPQEGPTDDELFGYGEPWQYGGVHSAPYVPGIDAAELATLFGLDPATGRPIASNVEAGALPLHPYDASDPGRWDPTLDDIMRGEEELERTYGLNVKPPIYEE